MTRGGQRKEQDEPERRCIVTGRSGPKAGLVRFVAGPDDMVMPDLAEKLPGRGMWVSSAHGAIAQAARKNLFSRAARQPLRVPPDLPEMVERLLARRLVDLISLARKAGDAICGLEKVRSALEKDEVAVLLQASDGSARGKSTLRPPTRTEGSAARGTETQADTYFDCLSADELGMAFGRETVIHAALKRGGLTERIVPEAHRLRALRSPEATPAVRRGGPLKPADKG